MASPNKKPYLLRLSHEAFEALQQWADDEFRSVNAQMEYLLLESLKKAGRKPRPPRAVEPTPDKPDKDEAP